MCNSPNEVKLFTSFHGIVKLVQCVLHCILLGIHLFTESSKMGFTQPISTALMTLNEIIIGCNVLVILFFFVLHKEIFAFLLEIIIFYLDLCCAILLWADAYSNIDSNTIRKIHLVVYSLVWILQTSLLAIPTLKYFKRDHQNVVGNQSPKITCSHFNNQQSCGRFGYTYDGSSEHRTNELPSLKENASFYFFGSDSNDISVVDLDNTQIMEGNTDLYSAKNINQSILESDFESCGKEENEALSIVENIELKDESTVAFSKEIVLPLKLSRNINETETRVSNYEPTNSNQPVGFSSPKASNSSTASESKLSTGKKKMYKVEFAEALEESNLELDTTDEMTEKREMAEFQTLLNPVKKEYIRTKTFSNSQSLIGNIESNRLIPGKQFKESDVVSFSEDNFQIDATVENEGNRSSKSVGSKISWNLSQNSTNISIIMIQGHRFQKETINRLKESLRPLSVIEKIKKFF